MAIFGAPNILFITDDQHRYDYLEMTGQFPVSTPNLARLAREGVWHRHAYSVCPLCMPARCSLHTGLYAHQHGVTRNFRHWPLGLPAFPQLLRSSGYRTAAIGKVHVFEAVPERLDLESVREQVMSFGYDELIEVAGKQMPYSGVQCDWSHDILDDDPFEMHNRINAPDCHDIREALATRLTNRMKVLGDDFSARRQCH
jgi:arylsulfatase A-like enzyme